MAKITVQGGDFYKGKVSLFLGQLTLKSDKHKWVGENIKITEFEKVEIVTEENKKKVLGTVGWGAAGALMLGPLGLLAGLLLGGKKKEVCFAGTFKDGRKLLATTDAKTFKKIMGAAF